MFNEFFNNFNMFKHNNVQLILNTEELTPDILDFDFTISNIINSNLSVAVTIYNLEVDKLKTLRIYCNNNLAFETQDFGIADISMQTNETSIATNINANIYNIKIPNILPKNTVVENKGKPLIINGKALKTTKDYVFNPTDDDNAKFSTILKGEGYGAFCMDLENVSVVIDKNTDKKQSIGNVNNLLILQILESYGSEELAIISLYNPLLYTNQTFQYVSKLNNVEKNYTIISVITTWKCKSGLIQTVTAKTGQRLTDFLTGKKG